MTEDSGLRLECKRKQYLVWDTGVKRLHVLVSPGGARTYRSLYYFPGSSKPHSRTLARVGVVSLAKAQQMCLADQAAAREGIDPKREGASRSDSCLRPICSRSMYGTWSSLPKRGGEGWSDYDAPWNLCRL